MNPDCLLVIWFKEVENHCQIPSISTHLATLDFKPELTAGNILQALAALIATGILGAAIQNRNSNKRKEKDILIDDVQSIVKLIDRLIELEPSSHIVEVTSLLKHIQVSVSAIRTCLCDLRYSKELLALVPSESCISIIRKLATDTPIKDIETHAKSKKCTASVRNGIITLTQERRAALENELRSARLNLQKLRLNLNRR